MTNATLKNPVLGITDLNYQIVGGVVQLYVAFETVTTTGMKFSVQVNKNSYLKTIKLTYLAIDNAFPPAVSLNTVSRVTLF